jgi:hypothetical protein
LYGYLAELQVPGDPGERLTREATFDDGAQEVCVPGGMRKKVIRFVLGRHEPGFGETRDKRSAVGWYPHVGHWSTAGT